MDVLGSSKTALQGLELAQSNVQWVREHYAEVIQWIQSQTIVSSATQIGGQFVLAALLASVVVTLQTL